MPFSRAEPGSKKKEKRRGVGADTNERNVLSPHCCDLPRTFVRTESLKMCQIDVEIGPGSKNRCFPLDQGEPRRYPSIVSTPSPLALGGASMNYTVWDALPSALCTVQPF